MRTVVAGRITQPTKCPRESDLRRYQGDLLQSVDADRYPPMVPPGEQLTADRLLVWFVAGGGIVNDCLLQNLGECVAPGANEKDRARSDFGYGASWLIGKRRISPKRGEPGVTPILVVCRINTRLRRQGPIGGDLQRRLQRAITWTTLCKRNPLEWRPLPQNPCLSLGGVYFSRDSVNFALFVTQFRSEIRDRSESVRQIVQFSIRPPRWGHCVGANAPPPLVAHPPLGDADCDIHEIEIKDKMGCSGSLFGIVKSREAFKVPASPEICIETGFCSFWWMRRSPLPVFDEVSVSTPPPGWHADFLIIVSTAPFWTKAADPIAEPSQRFIKLDVHSIRRRTQDVKTTCRSFIKENLSRDRVTSERFPGVLITEESGNFSADNQDKLTRFRANQWQWSWLRRTPVTAQGLTGMNYDSPGGRTSTSPPPQHNPHLAN
ncbi:hypothetical protein GEV33_014238 [Tenebrio molitor]|uniref:Uncharacterized protein n=1 Tax=Tenebrio molitor TaxID=7067 RepID=A0A8J6L1Y8_TENMO|nr:hypothetical protein GEV33_014238 [Tenebrio molitor]